MLLLPHKNGLTQPWDIGYCRALKLLKLRPRPRPLTKFPFTVFFFSKNSPEASQTVVVVVGIYSEQKRIYIHSIDQDGCISAFCVSKKEKKHEYCLVVGVMVLVVGSR